MMIEWSTTYIISQVLIVFVYVFLCLTYFLSDRKKILIINIVSYILQSISLLLIGGFTGGIMSFLYIVRDSYFIISGKDTKNSEITKRDYIVLIFLIILIIVSSIFTFNGWLSLLPVVAAILSTIAIWQRSVEVYKLLGIPISICWIGYNIFIKSLFAFVLESILLIFIIVGYFSDRIKQK